ncbi:MAG: hypothetical protein WC360_01335 [Opitutales bacterium]|jgi:hypothetical protein
MINKSEDHKKTKVPTPTSPGEEILETIKHGAHGAKTDAIIIGGDIKTAAKSMAHRASKGSKDMYTSSKEGLTEASEKVMDVTSHAAAKVAKSAHKAAHHE